ncbi:peptidoglycan glycosyltransferase [Actinoplanes sp. N902-109]|nr:penicillin-binding transpeptidase domain-containing protein [Actinoplanes sp. N902-109]AGL15523.1 peptidoglycan glycosyltransferase [Actinoplanes sp. N902-109]
MSPEQQDPEGGERGFGGIGDARAYTPRGRTVRETDQRTRSPRAGRTGDPFRPALQVLDGGRPVRDRRRGDGDRGRDDAPVHEDDHAEDGGRADGHGGRGNGRVRRGDEHGGRDDGRVEDERGGRGDGWAEQRDHDEDWRDDGGSELPPQRRARSRAGDRRSAATRGREGDRSREAAAGRGAGRNQQAGGRQGRPHRDDDGYDDRSEADERRARDGRGTAGSAGRRVRDGRETGESPARRARDDRRTADPKDRRAAGDERRSADPKGRRTADERDRQRRAGERGRSQPTRTTAGTARSRAIANPRRGSGARGRDAGQIRETGMRSGPTASVDGSRLSNAARLGDRGAARLGDRGTGRLGEKSRLGEGRFGERRGRAGAARSTGRGMTDPRTGRPESRTGRIPAEPPKLANSSRRLRLGTVLALSLFVTIGVRLVVLQVVDSSEQVAAVAAQRDKRLTKVVLPAPRGSILDRNGAVLAHSVEARYIYADPEMVKDPQAVAAQLSPLLGVAQSRLVQLMAKNELPGGGESRFEYLARGVDISTANTINKLDLAGIGSGRDERRDVPGADLAANLIGFTGEDHTGLEGLEARYDDLLRGTDGKKVYETGRGDLAKQIPGGYNVETPAAPGSSIELTIDSYLQYEVQKYLTQYMEDNSATVAGAVVMDVKTGEVLAQASYPTYNAQKPFDSKPSERDDAVTSIITDPGSTHKAFTIGAALQEGVITPDTQITVGKGLKLGGATFSDTHGFANGTKLTVAQVLAYSSNIGTIQIADKLGKDKLYEYQQKFGLGRATNEGVPGEAPGKLIPPDEWSGSSYGSIPIGHSVDATLLQMVAGYSAIANDGVYIQPHLIKSTVSGRTGKATAPASPETHRVLSPEVSAELREMMEAVVDAKGATGTKAKVEGYRVAGKTGTGKMLVDGQYTTHNAGSFIGMAPAENPRFVVGVFADVPNGTGGDVAAPAFSKMMAAALRHYYVPPSGTPAPKFNWKD